MCVWVFDDGSGLSGLKWQVCTESQADCKSLKMIEKCYNAMNEL